MTAPAPRLTGEQVRSIPLEDFASLAASINDSDQLMRIYAAPEWEQLHDDGQMWVIALVRETMARLADGFPVTIADDRPARGILIGLALSLLLWLTLASVTWAVVS